jgi:hypothetical protein
MRNCFPSDTAGALAGNIIVPEAHPVVVEQAKLVRAEEKLGHSSKPELLSDRKHTH